MLDPALLKRAQQVALRLERSLNPPLSQKLHPFWLHSVAVGQLSADLLNTLLSSPDLTLYFEASKEGGGSLRENCYWAKAQGALLRHFRLFPQHECLSLNVHSETIDRALCRVLGTPTTVVRLSVIVDNQILLSVRSPTKRINPGRYDNLAAGMVKHEETPRIALEREAWEEAGIKLGKTEHGAEKLFRGFRSHRPLPEGLLSESTELWRLSERITPHINDGEVQRFEWVSVERFLDLAETELIVPEASLAILLSLLSA